MGRGIRDCKVRDETLAGSWKCQAEDALALPLPLSLAFQTRRPVLSGLFLLDPAG